MIFKSLGAVKKYRRGKVLDNIDLPDKEPGCLHCYFLRYSDGKGRFWCDATGEPLFRDQITKRIGELCPVEWEKKRNDILNSDINARRY